MKNKKIDRRIILGTNAKIGKVNGVELVAKTVYVKPCGYLADIYVELDKKSTDFNLQFDDTLADQKVVEDAIKQLVKKNGLKGYKDICRAELGMQADNELVFETDNAFEHSITSKFGWEQL